MHGSVDDWFLQLWLLAWRYESRPANFYQGPSPWEKPESAFDAGAVWVAPVFRADERGGLAGQWATGFLDACVDGFAQGIGEVVCVNGP